ncbi:hypothetical protein JOF28_000536 [Leucobacter exalbidus]|uniref:PH domain-containing protein n=1 Tax=Leucobacter exalbidus TaxID=662960 RepID=A0A940T342_9MICO|nr:hypothetical protein [Leucobacter exalbidus]MBP1325304.1 hypothetical protein [Leucobacter exalbidus]
MDDLRIPELEFRATRGRSFVLWFLAIALLLGAIAFASLMISATIGADMVWAGVPLLLFFAALIAFFFWLAIANTGVILVLGPEGLRHKDMAGWITVPWGAIVETSTKTRYGECALILTAPGAIYLNRRALRRRTLQVQTERLKTGGYDIKAEIERRIYLARGGVPLA